MRPIERIDRTIDLLKKLVRKYPDKEFGTLMEEAFFLLQNQYFGLYISGNKMRSKFLAEWFHGKNTDSPSEMDGNEDAQMQNIKEIMDKVLEFSDKKDEESGRVHPMLVEDDIIEVIFKIMLEI